MIYWSGCAQAKVVYVSVSIILKGQYTVTLYIHMLSPIYCDTVHSYVVSNILQMQTILTH